jgi:hypothetical protein
VDSLTVQRERGVYSQLFGNPVSTSHSNAKQWELFVSHNIMEADSLLIFKRAKQSFWELDSFWPHFVGHFVKNPTK